jgi:sarcosine oxidase
MNDVDVIVVGAGVMGAATARALSKRGRQVVVLERSTIGHDQGSSHGSARIWRHSYTDARYVRMMDEALPLWRSIEDETGTQLLSVCGALNIGAGLDDLASAMGEGGAASEWLDPAEIPERFPDWPARIDDRALFDPLAGVIAAEHALSALIASARNRGALVIENTPVALERTAHGLAAGEWRAPVAVVTAGAWARDLLAPLGITLDVTVTRETVAHYDVGDAAADPVFIEWGDPAIYVLPTPEPSIVKAAEHIAGRVVDPDSPGGPDARALERIEGWFSRRFPSISPTRVDAETCLYTNTRDGNFVLERHGPIVVGSACSGHGFKFAPLIGERLAELAVPGSSR